MAGGNLMTIASVLDDVAAMSKVAAEKTLDIFPEHRWVSP